ncbi:MAG: hypothetical protein IKW49_04040 [Opitutales bacterium]|nr:hypothetical protein [Opitutales bacterium]
MQNSSYSGAGMLSGGGQVETHRNVIGKRDSEESRGFELAGRSRDGLSTALS